MLQPRNNILSLLTICIYIIIVLLATRNLYLLLAIHTDIQLCSTRIATSIPIPDTRAIPTLVAMVNLLRPRKSLGSLSNKDKAFPLPQGSSTPGKQVKGDEESRWSGENLAPSDGYSGLVRISSPY